MDAAQPATAVGLPAPRALGVAAAFGVAYAAAIALAVRLAPEPGGVYAFWPAAGVYLGAALLAPPRRWPALAAVALAVDLAFAAATGYGAGAGFLFWLGNSVEAALGAWLATRLAGGRPRLETVGGVAALLAGVAVSTAAGAAVGVAGVAAAGGLVGWTTWRTFWVGDLVGAILVAPGILAGADARLRDLGAVRTSRALEAGALVVALLASTRAVFGPRADMAPQLFWLAPPLVWAAARFAPLGASLAALLVAAAGTWATARGRGEFAVLAAPAAALRQLQVFLGVATSVMLALSAAVSERRRTERALAASLREQALLAVAVEQSADAIALLAPDGRVVHANDAAARLAGVPRDRLVGRATHGLDPGFTAERWQAFWGELRAKGAVRREVRVERPGGPALPVEYVAHHVASADGEWAVISARDVSDRHRAQDSLHLAALGTLAAGVAHEVNNPLSFVIANLGWVREGLERQSPLRDDARQEMTAALADAEEGAIRVRDIVRDLRTFSRPDEQVRAPLDVRDPLRSALSMAQNEIRHRARLVTSLEPAPRVLANPGRLVQVFLNLLVNAAQALPEGAADGHEIRVATGADAAGHAVVSVSDTGRGISPGVRARIFDPFFTTKPAGVGTGLGLSICHGIVAALGGEIEVESEEGRGSTFRVRLPPAPEEAPAPLFTPPPRTPAPSRARILVVDDEPLVGTAVQRVLSEHEVVALCDGRDAVARIEAGERFDVVLCDLMMPTLSGMDLHARVVRAAPELRRRLVFITGGAFTDRAAAFLDETRARCLAKPFAPDELRTAVDEVLAARRAAPG